MIDEAATQFTLRLPAEKDETMAKTMRVLRKAMTKKRATGDELLRLCLFKTLYLPQAPSTSPGPALAVEPLKPSARDD